MYAASIFSLIQITNSEKHVLDNQATKAKKTKENPSLTSSR